jgi:hypothetical protein
VIRATTGSWSLAKSAPSSGKSGVDVDDIRLGALGQPVGDEDVVEDLGVALEDEAVGVVFLQSLGDEVAQHLVVAG